jgi:hypothetical protein
MKTNESIGSDLKTKIGDEMLNAGVMANGMEGVLAANEFKRDIPENKGNKKINKKLMNKGDNKKKENKESTGSGSAGGYSGPLFSTTKQEMQEKCWTGFEQKGMKKKGNRMVPNCVREGKENDIKKVEATEATDSGSSGQYSTTSVWAKSTNKKDWAGRKKTQIPGGKFVQVKAKCKKFPYCNQGDIKALKIFENEKIKQAIQNISKRHNISENVIKTIIAYEYENTFSKK